MRHLLIGLAVSCVVAVTAMAEPPSRESQEIQPPPHHVIAAYFHRTERCPTCKRIGALTTEAVTKGFPKQLKAKAVQVRMIDFQDKKNAHLTAFYTIKGPTLILMDVTDGKVTRWMPMPRVWQLVGQTEKFHTYVHQGVETYLTGQAVAPETVQ
jgi:hypothetical protein